MSPAHVSVVTRPLWRLRAGPVLTRALIRGAAVVGLLASARFALDPPRSVVRRSVATTPVDLPAQGYVTLFTRRYLPWDAAAPDAHQRGLAGFAGNGMDPDAGMRLPTAGRQSVRWAQVVQERPEAADEWVYTVAAETDAGELEYLSVPVRHPPQGAVSLAGYPALVGPPSAAAGGDVTASLPDVEDPSLAAVVRRALANYLSGSASELAADLGAGARVSLPTTPLTLDGVQSLKWSPGGSVIAVSDASDADGVQYTLAYEMDVVRAGARWEVTAIQMDPTA